MREIFSEELAHSERFVNQVKDILAYFYEQGARATLVQTLAARAD